jgi:tRNA(fMet)-specific endonuclease VapC
VILDTNALSAVADDEPGVVKVYRQAVSMELPVILIGEEETSRHYAGIRAALKKAGRPIPSNDLWIAALCRQHRLPLLSQDRHFDAVEGLDRVAW